MKASADQPSEATHITVQPMTVHIGAEIGGVDLTQPLNPVEIDTIRQALLRWKVIFFRDQFLNHDRHPAACDRGPPATIASPGREDEF